MMKNLISLVFSTILTFGLVNISYGDPYKDWSSYVTTTKLHADTVSGGHPETVTKEFPYRTFCALSKVEIEDIDDDSGNEWARCRVSRDNDRKWTLRAQLGDRNDDADSRCEAKCITFSPKMPGFNSIRTSREHHSWASNGHPADKFLASASNNTCFLTGYQAENSDTGDEHVKCAVFKRNNNWYLHANVQNPGDDQEVACWARCLEHTLLDGVAASSAKASTWDVGESTNQVITYFTSPARSRGNSQDNLDYGVNNSYDSFCALTYVKFRELDSEGEWGKCYVADNYVRANDSSDARAECRSVCFGLFSF